MAAGHLEVPCLLLKALLTKEMADVAHDHLIRSLPSLPLYRMCFGEAVCSGAVDSFQTTPVEPAYPVHTMLTVLCCSASFSAGMAAADKQNVCW